MLDLNKHIATNFVGMHSHSNGLARMANGNRLGSVGTTSYSQRQQAGSNRQFVGEYKHSAIGKVRAIDYQSPGAVTGRNGRIKIPQRPSLKSHSALNDGGRHFCEPSTRGYNPFH